MAKQRARRGEPPLPAATVVIRGDLRDPDALAESAQRNFDVYGFYGISVFAETLDLSWADLAASRFAAAPRLRGRAIADAYLTILDRRSLQGVSTAAARVVGCAVPDVAGLAGLPSSNTARAGRHSTRRCQPTHGTRCWVATWTGSRRDLRFGRV